MSLSLSGLSQAVSHNDKEALTTGPDYATLATKTEFIALGATMADTGFLTLKDNDGNEFVIPFFKNA